MNPWVSIWLKPRQTIRQIVDTNPQYLVLPLILVIGGIVGPTGYPRFLSGLFHVSGPFALIMEVGLGCLSSLIGLYVFGWLYRWVGSWFGGQAKNVEVRTVIAWLQIPMFVALLLWFCSRSVSSSSHLLAIFLFIAGCGVSVWGSVLTCHALGEVHHFSAWKGLGTMVLSVLFSAPVWVPVVIVGALLAP